MISWKIVHREEGRIESDIVQPCKICNQKNRSDFSVEQNCFFMFWMPLFPTSRIIYRICPDCKSRLKIKNNDPDLTWIQRQLPKKFRIAHWYGSFIVGPALIVFIYYFNTIFPNFWD